MTEGKKINQYELNGFQLILVDTYNSISEAERKTGIDKTGISAALNGRRASAGGYFWKFDDGKKYPITEIPSNFPIPIARVGLYDGNVYAIYPTLHEAAKRTHINISMISKCLKGEISDTNCFVWKYVTELNQEQKISYVYRNSPYKLVDTKKKKPIYAMEEEEFERFLEEIKYENIFWDSQIVSQIR